MEASNSTVQFCFLKYAQRCLLSSRTVGFWKSESHPISLCADAVVVVAVAMVGSRPRYRSFCSHVELATNWSVVYGWQILCCIETVSLARYNRTFDFVYFSWVITLSKLSCSLYEKVIRILIVEIDASWISTCMDLVVLLLFFVQNGLWLVLPQVLTVFSTLFAAFVADNLIKRNFLSAFITRKIFQLTCKYRKLSLGIMHPQLIEFWSLNFCLSYTGGLMRIMCIDVQKSNPWTINEARITMRFINFRSFYADTLKLKTFNRNSFSRKVKHNIAHFRSLHLDWPLVVLLSILNCTLSRFFLANIELALIVHVTSHL